MGHETRDSGHGDGWSLAPERTIDEVKGDVWSIALGMTMDEVRAALGPPWRVATDINGPEPGGEGLRWLYPAEKEGTPISWIYFGFDDSRRVETIDYGIHLGH